MFAVVDWLTVSANAQMSCAEFIFHVHTVTDIDDAVDIVAECIINARDLTVPKILYSQKVKLFRCIFFIYLGQLTVDTINFLLISYYTT